MIEEHKRTSKRVHSNPATVTHVVTDHDSVRHEIELRAYFRYCQRGDVPGGDLED